MATAEAVEFIPVSDYLEGEKHADVRHEYLNGIVVAMAGASRRHNTIAGNLFAAVHGHLKDHPYRPYMGDLKVGIKRRSETLFYYPDVVVECQSTEPEDDYYTTEPSVIIEVLSPSTERIDRREKFWAYMELDSLQEYVLVDQQSPSVTLFRRSDDWNPKILSALTDTLAFASIDFQIPLQQIYTGIDFTASS